MDKVRVLFFSIIWIIVSSCTDKRIFEEFHPIENMIWSEKDSIIFNLQEVNSLEGSNLIAIRFNENYAYSNCYIRLISKDSSRQVLENKLLNVPIFHSKSGQPLGKGFGNTYTKYDTIPFKLPAGTKELVILQYMRQGNLEGIEAVGFKILKP